MLPAAKQKQLSLTPKNSNVWIEKTDSEFQTAVHNAGLSGELQDLAGDPGFKPWRFNPYWSWSFVPKPQSLSLVDVDQKEVAWEGEGPVPPALRSGYSPDLDRFVLFTMK